MSFNIGDRVVVRETPEKYPDVPRWAVGTVRYARPDRDIGVDLDHFYNHNSGIGRFYFKSFELTAAEGRFDGVCVPHPLANALTYSAQRILDNAFPLELHRGDAFEFKVDPDPMFEIKKEETPMNNMYNEKNCRVACISFDDYSDKTYSYALFLNDVEPGDRVVARNYNGALTIGTLTRITDDGHENVKNGCEVICAIDMTEFNKRQEQFAKAADLRKRMDARVKALQEISLYELLAKDDPELANLLAEFKMVNG